MPKQTNSEKPKRSHPNSATDPWGRESYTIDEIDCLGYVLDACTGRVKAVLHRGGSVVIGEPLCGGCDAPLADGPCGCVTPAGSPLRHLRRALRSDRMAFAMMCAVFAFAIWS